MTIAMRGGLVGGAESPQENTSQTSNPLAMPVNQPHAVADENAVTHVEDGESSALLEGQEPEFPHAELARLDEMINRPRWVVPVLPKGELEVLLDASIDLCKRGLDVHSEACQRFFRDGLTLSFTKILTDEAVSGWKYEIHKCIMKNCERLIELCVTKLNQDWFPLLDLLAMLFNPTNKFHMYNGNRASETLPSGSQISDEELFAKPSDPRAPKGWLVDLVNLFGQLGGFQLLLERFQNGPSLTVPVIAALIRPFGLCYELLTVHVIEKYFMPLVAVIPTFLDNLADDELNKEAKNEAKNDALSAIIKALKCLVSRVPNHEDMIKNLEIFRLKMILRLLQISPFNGKMNALNEVNKLIASVSYFSHRHGTIEEEEWLTAERMAEWIKDNRVLQIVLHDNLHQPQYVEKLEKIIRFIIKEKTLSMDDLDSIWAAQSGKHEAIVKNVHDLLAKLAWDFAPEQLDHLFDCFQISWTNASKKQREKLLELIRRLAEDDKDGVMAHKVLSLLWNLAHSDDVPTEIMDQALSAHVKILDYSCSQDRDSQKTQWLDKCVAELKNDKWVLPALKQIREICCLYQEAPSNFNHAQRTPHTFYRHEVINRLQQQHSLVILVAENLTAYMNKARAMAKENPSLDPLAIWPDSRYSHLQQVQERLLFLRFLLKDGQLWLCAPQAKQIWQCLAENAVFVSDREACFKWFSKLMSDDPDLDPDINKDFFENNILQLDPCLLTENGMKCFDRFFKAVNTKECKLLAKRRAYLMDDEELIGQDYIWRVVLCSGEEIANKSIQLLKETYTNLGPKLQNRRIVIHEDFIQSCMDRLKATYDTISVLEHDKDNVNPIRQETTRMVRVLKVLYEYISECDSDYGEERTYLPMARAYRGKHVTLLVRFPNQGRQVDDLDIWTHTNETLASVRRQILNRVKVNNANMKVDLFVNGDPLDVADDKKLISQIPLRDKSLINAKLSQVGSNMPSSPDSSSDSSTGSPQHPLEGPNPDQEKFLPGVIMAQHCRYAQFLFQLADLGSALQIPHLRDGARAVLRIMPADTETVRKLRSLSLEYSQVGIQTVTPSLESFFFPNSPSQVLYNLEITYSLLMPAFDPMSDEAFEIQYNFIQSGGVPCILGMLVKNNFLTNADVATKRAAYHVVLKICKLLLSTVAHAVVHLVAQNMSNPLDGATTKVTPSVHAHAVVLQQALQHIPNPHADCMLRNVASRLAQHLPEQVMSHIPDMPQIQAIIRIAWASSSAAMHLVHAPLEELHKMHDKVSQKPVNSEDQGGKQPENEDIQVCKESLEVLTLCLVLYPQGLEQLTKDKMWQHFIIDLVLHCQNKSVRVSAAEQFLLMATRCSTGHQPLLFFITLLFTVLATSVQAFAKNSHEYFQLLCRLLNCACANNYHLTNVEKHLSSEIVWLMKIKDNVKQTGDIQVEEALLEGHLGVAKELVCFLKSEAKHAIVCDETKKISLIKELVEDFVFPASKLMLQYYKTGEMPSEPAIPVCSTTQSMVAACDLLVALATGSVENMRLLADTLKEIYNSDKEPPLVEWEYVPPVGPRPLNGFVGLKNAGATCYMNSVLQQLFMIDSIRTGILAAEGACDDVNEDFSGEEKLENETNNMESGENENFGEEKVVSKEESRRDYNVGVLKQIQAIFGHLACSKLQYYIPRGLWKHFKLGGEPVNLREQHDALEFFNSLVDSVDEALKALGHEQILSNVLGGSFADQKICKGCPHRYSREESFTTLNIDIRNHSNLLDSLEQYVKGDLLEGANAYHCEKCCKKVDTVKRMCIKKLPPILAIQLKRFDYDWERECAVKFNDYFEFPRELDMDPYTVSGLAKMEKEAVQSDNDFEEEAEDPVCPKYKLTGVVVHSGQASGGHYYSYILHRHSDGAYKWYKFDDGDVTECKMDDNEEMKNQCFGGEYMGEVFDHMLKRMSYRRQKRWWNAYILFYTRLDVENENMVRNLQELSLGNNKLPVVKMPLPIERCIRRQNIRFMHNRNQFSVEYFMFMKKLIGCNAPYVNLHSGLDRLSAAQEELAMISIQLGSSFLFNTGFHSKKTLRGSANEWYEAMCVHLRSSKTVRLWFANNVLFNHPNRFAEYLLECPSSEVRAAFVKIIVFLAHFSINDGPCPLPAFLENCHIDVNATLSEHLLLAILLLLKKEVSEHGRHLAQYFSLFLMYASLGVAEKTQLLKLNVPATFMLVALDEGPGPPIRYQYAELGKLYQLVSQLIRCCDVASKMQSSIQGKAPLQNVHGDSDCQEFIMPIQPQVAEILYNRPSYVKKIIEDANTAEDTVKLLTFCSWENPHFSSMVLSELLWQIAYSYTYELRPYLDLLFRMLLLEDSWQNHRIHNALKGIPDDRDGLFDTIQRSKNHYQKRAYQCIKCLVVVFSACPAAMHMLHNNGDLKRKWTWAVEWLNGELDRRPYSTNAQYTYSSWSPPAQSNETSNGYFLERSHSARITLSKAIALCPEEEQEQEMSEEGENLQLEENETITFACKTAAANQQQQQQQQSLPPQQPPQDQQIPTNSQQQQQSTSTSTVQQLEQQMLQIPQLLQQQNQLPSTNQSCSQTQPKLQHFELDEMKSPRYRIHRINGAEDGSSE